MHWLGARWRAGAAASRDARPVRLSAGRKLFVAAAWAYLIAAFIAWAIIGIGADRWWPATVLMFGPRWIGLLPLVVLVPAALWLRRRLLFVLLAAGGIVLIPVMGFCIPWRAAVHRHSAAEPLRVLTCNIHRYALDIVAMRNLIERTRPDVVTFQEWSSRYDGLFAQGEWHVQRDGELFVASRFPILRTEDFTQPQWGSAGAAARYELALPHGTLHLLNIHLASPHPAFEAVLDRSPDAAEQVRANSALRRRQSEFVDSVAKGIQGPLLITGDFNTPSESAIFNGCWPGLSDAFTDAGWGLGYTYYSRQNAVRIDHVLFNNRFTCARCEAGPDVGSPHRPVFAELWLRSSGKTIFG